MKESKLAQEVFPHRTGPGGKVIFAFQDEYHFGLASMQSGLSADVPFPARPGVVSLATWKRVLANPQDGAALGQANIEHPGCLYYVPEIRQELARWTWIALYHPDLAKRQDAERRIMQAAIPTGAPKRRGKAALMPFPLVMAFDGILCDVVAVRTVHFAMKKEPERTLAIFPQLKPLANLQGRNVAKSFLYDVLLPDVDTAIDPESLNTPQAVAAQILAKETDYAHERIKRICAGRARPPGLPSLAALTAEGKRLGRAILAETRR